MALILKSCWGYIKPKGRQQTEKHLSDGSEMFVNFVEGEKCPALVYIEIHGALAQIPSLKNNRQFGGIDFRTLAAIRALDSMFAKAIAEQNISQSKISFGSEMIHIAIIAGGRATANEDNAMTTIKDWLEPRTKAIGRKNRRDRGWGIGLIQDDIQARGYALKASDVGLSQNYTAISIQPWATIQEDAMNFMARCRSTKEAA